MALQATSRAAAVGAAVNNVQFKPSAENVAHKICIIGTFDPAKTAVVAETKYPITSPEDAGNTFGFGFMIHRLAVAADKGSDGVEMWVVPQDEVGASVQGDGQFAITGTATEVGTLAFYCGGVRVAIDVSVGDTAVAVATAMVAAITAEITAPVTAVLATSDVDVTAKSTGLHWGNDMPLAVSQLTGEAVPAGLAVVITDMLNGTTTPDIADALNVLGINDNQNEDNFTEIIHGYGDVTQVLDDISAYNGAGNGFVGNYAKLVSRPFRTLVGDIEPDSAGLTAALALANGRKLDRSNGVISAPGSASHPSEIAATALGVMAKTNNDRAAQSYIGLTLPGILPGLDNSTRWTDSYDNRDTAVKDGVSPTLLQDGVLKLQNVMTFYHPDSVPATSNGYASQRNVSILQNILFNVRQNFSQEKWQGISIVADVAQVSSTVDRQKARDTDAVLDDLVALTFAFEGKAWIYTAAFTVDQLASNPALVEIRAGGIGFNATLPVLLSGEGGIIDTVVEFDTSLAVLLGG